MPLVLANRVQETATANTTVSFTLAGAVTGFQTFAIIGDTNTTYYSATDVSGNWEVGLGTYSTTGPTLTRTTIYASSNAGNAVTFPGTVNVFVTYPSGRSVNLDASGNVSALGTVSSGTWQGTTVGVAYGGTGVTASSGANSVMLRDANQNVSINRLNQANATTTAAGGTTALTAASSYSQTLVGTGNQTYTMPDATGLTTGLDFIFNNNATGTLTLRDYANGLIGTVASGGAAELVLLDNSTTAGTWDLHGFLPEGVTFGTNAFNLGTSVISGGTWQGGTIQPAYGGTGLTTFVVANNALYSTGATTLTAGTLPVAAGGTGITAFGTGVATALGVNVGTAGSFVVNGGALGTPASGTVTNLTGTANININGTVGGTTQYPGAFTSITSISGVGILTRAAANQDGVNIFGRAGGTANREVKITPTTLTADRTLTLPDNSGTVLTTGATVTIAQGGTGQTTANAAFNALAPSQTSQSGRYLTTDGTNTSWGTVNQPPSLSNDTSTATAVYPLFAAATSGTPSILYTSNAKLLYTPSSGELRSSALVASNGIVVNSTTVSANYTIASGTNGQSVGPITVASGATVTVSSGQRWLIV